MEDTKANDFAVAKALNSNVVAMILAVCMADTFGMPEDHDIKELNRVYVLLVNELQKLYDRNPELAAIKPEPIWQRFDLIKTSTWEINEYLSEHSNDELNAHTARVEKLCIISGKETHDYSTEQKKLVDYAQETLDKYIKTIDENHKQNKANEQDNWQIPEYTLKYDPVRGTIKINDVYQLNKRSTNDSSSIDKILAKGMKQPNELFDPELQTSKPISSVISNAGFTPTLRQLFIPVARKGKGALVRPRVTRTEADNEGIDTTELDLLLKKLGAITEPKTLN
jgi:hypothetical protein